MEIPTFRVQVPTSKSVSNRLLMMQRTCGFHGELRQLSEAGDTRLLQALLRRMDEASEEGLTVLDVRNCGTAFRFLLPYAAACKGRWRIVGEERLRQRPIRPLVEVLRRWGVQITMPETGSFPIDIVGNPALRPCDTLVDVSESSQFLSALLLVLPMLHQPVRLRYAADAASMPYVRLSVRLLQQCGLHLRHTEGEIAYQPSETSAFSNDWVVPADWSSAAFWWAWVAVQPAPVRVELPGLSDSDVQADAVVHRRMEAWGVHTSFTPWGAVVEKRGDLILPSRLRWDGRDCLDLVPLMVVCGVLLQRPAVFTGIGNLRHKESDRVEALRANLRGLAAFRRCADTLSVRPLAHSAREFAFSSFQDHRVVMSLALFSVLGKVRFDHPETVAKSYPGFWEQFARVCPERG
ncbi:MAG: hypothetical protein J5873_01620 [Bacteroidales bacterium]|nr:hypothetical protein [Bacteroidales bacterium]